MSQANLLEIENIEKSSSLFNFIDDEYIFSKADFIALASWHKNTFFSLADSCVLFIDVITQR